MGFMQSNVRWRVSPHTAHLAPSKTIIRVRRAFAALLDLTLICRGLLPQQNALSRGHCSLRSQKLPRGARARGPLAALATFPTCSLRSQISSTTTVLSLAASRRPLTGPCSLRPRRACPPPTAGRRGGSAAAPVGGGPRLRPRSRARPASPPPPPPKKGGRASSHGLASPVPSHLQQVACQK